jgi:hypothetical protein
MTVTVATLIAPKEIETAQTVQYVDGTGKTIVDKFTVLNTDILPHYFSVNLVVSGGSAGTTNLVLADKTVQPSQTYLCPELVGQVLEAGTAISAISSGAGLIVSAGGRKVT